MQITPNVAIWLNVLYGVLTGITAPALQAAGVANAAQVVAIASILAAPLNIVLHAFSSADKGVLAKDTRKS